MYGIKGLWNSVENILYEVHFRRNLGRVTLQFNICEFLIIFTYYKKRIAWKPNLEEVDVEIHWGVERGCQVGETARDSVTISLFVFLYMILRKVIRHYCATSRLAQTAGENHIPDILSNSWKSEPSFGKCLYKLLLLAFNAKSTV